MDYNIFKSPLRHFIKAKINGGAVLLFVAAAAMIIANTPLRETYDAFFAKEVILQFGDINLFHVHGRNMTFMSLINDALMAIFFFSVGLKQTEALVGELSSPLQSFTSGCRSLRRNARPHPHLFPDLPRKPCQPGSRHPDGHGYRFLIGSIILTRETHPPEPENLPDHFRRSRRYRWHHCHRSLLQQ